jgi:hypothetical protein
MCHPLELYRASIIAIKIAIFTQGQVAKGREVSQLFMVTGHTLTDIPRHINIALLMTAGS